VFSFNLESSWPPIIPSKVQAVVHSTVEYQCLSTYKTKWTFNHYRLPKNAIEIEEQETNTTILKIVDVQLNNSGNYFCVATSHNGTFYSVANMEVIENVITGNPYNIPS